MTQVDIVIGATDVVAHRQRAVGEAVFGIPVGIDVLTAHHLESDPPRPEELTNAIGAVVDHLDDLVRIDPDVIGATTTVRGPEAEAIAAVEVGAAPTLPFALTREAAEDVFRTLATEGRADRALNPGLDPDLVDRAVAGCCVVVGVMRRLHLSVVTVAP